MRGQLDICRLTARGLTRRRRGASRTAAISANPWARRRVQALGGKSQGPGERAADHMYRVGEREAVRIRRGLHGRVVEELADGIGGQEIAIGFLLHALGRLAAEHHPGPALGCLEFIEELLDLPPLVVQGRQLVGRRLGGIQPGGQQAIFRRGRRARRRPGGPG